MTDDQIRNYEIASKYRKKVRTFIAAMPFTVQEFGCGSQAPAIEHSLERVHKAMFNACQTAIAKAEESVSNIISNI